MEMRLPLFVTHLFFRSGMVFYHGERYVVLVSVCVHNGNDHYALDGTAQDETDYVYRLRVLSYNSHDRLFCRE